MRNNNGRWELMFLIVLCLCLLGIGLILGLLLGEKLGWVYKNQDLPSVNLSISLTLPSKPEVAEVKFDYSQFQVMTNSHYGELFIDHPTFKYSPIITNRDYIVYYTNFPNRRLISNSLDTFLREYY